MAPPHAPGDHEPAPVSEPVIEPDGDPGEGSWSPADLAACALLVGLASWMALDSRVLPPTLGMDSVSYLAMAADPSAYLEVPVVHAQRPLAPLLVWAMGHVGVGAVTGFRVLSVASLHLFLPGVFLALRGAGVGRLVAFGTAVFTAISAWPVPYALSNVYQACDALAYPLGLLVVVATVHRRPGTVAAAAVAGALARQQLVVLGVAALVEGWWRTRDRRWALGLAVLLSVFGTVAFTAGRGDATLWAHTGAWLGAPGAALEGLWETRLPVLLSPFLLVLAADPGGVARYARRFWWVGLYVAATVTQPLLAFEITGASNAVRLAMLGVWPLFLLAGLRLEERWLRTKWSRWAYVGLPLLYGTSHLVSLETTWPSPVGHRAVVNALLLVVAVAASHLAAKRGGVGSDGAGRGGPVRTGGRSPF